MDTISSKKLDVLPIVTQSTHTLDDIEHPQGLQYCVVKTMASTYSVHSVVALPQDFLMGSCDTHPANVGKCHHLYKLFGEFLNNLGLWRNPEYLEIKAVRTCSQK